VNHINGHCDACHKETEVRGLNLILVRTKRGDHVAMICGPCFVDGAEWAAA